MNQEVVFELSLGLRLKPGEREPEYAPIYKSKGKIGPGARESVPDEKASLKRAKERSQGVRLDSAGVN